MDGSRKEGKLELIAAQNFTYYEEMYQVIDFLNKNLKGKGVVLGLKKDKATGRLAVNIYDFA